MKSNNQKIEVDKIVSDIKTAFKEIKLDLESGNLSHEELKFLKTGLEEAEFKSYVIKIGIHLDNLLSSSPKTPIRDVTIKLLSLMRQDASPSMVARISKFISEEWEKKSLKMAA